MTVEQENFFEHYGILDTHPAQQNRKTVDINSFNRDWREDLVHTPWPVAALHADTSFEINPPSYAMLRMEEHPPSAAIHSGSPNTGPTMRFPRLLNASQIP